MIDYQLSSLKERLKNKYVIIQMRIVINLLILINYYSMRSIEKMIKITYKRNYNFSPCLVLIGYI